MYSQIISQETLELVTLDEVKKQCRVFNDFEDEYLRSLIGPMSEVAQTYTGRMLTLGTAAVLVESYCPVVRLPFGEVTEVTEILVDGVATEEFTFEPITQKVKINVSFTEAKITFKAGFDVTPRVVTQAVLIAISTAFVNRDDVVVGQSIEKLPMTSLSLLDSVKFYGA